MSEPGDVPGVLPRTGSFPLVDAVAEVEVWQAEAHEADLERVQAVTLGTEEPVAYSCLLCRNTFQSHGVYRHVLCWAPRTCCHYGDLCRGVN